MHTYSQVSQTLAGAERFVNRMPVRTDLFPARDSSKVEQQTDNLRVVGSIPTLHQSFKLVTL